MTPLLLDGKKAAAVVRERTKQAVEQLAAAGIVPKLAAVLVGNNPASATYVRNKAKACREAGINSVVIERTADSSFQDVLAIVRTLNEDPSVHGILVQSPLPPHIEELAVTLAIDPAKDVDGFHPYNVGMLLLGKPVFASCTPAGVIELLRQNNLSPAGKRAVIIGRSAIVGKPLAALLMQRGEWADATVTIAHSRTPDLAAITSQADMLIAAIGRPRFVTADMVREGAVVIDVGINRIVGESGYRLVGDVDFDAVAPRCSAITPVPGGVGPMTIAMLLENTVRAAIRSAGLSEAILLS